MHKVLYIYRIPRNGKRKDNKKTRKKCVRTTYVLFFVSTLFFYPLLLLGHRMDFGEYSYDMQLWSRWYRLINISSSIVLCNRVNDTGIFFMVEWAGRICRVQSWSILALRLVSCIISFDFAPELLLFDTFFLHQ